MSTCTFTSSQVDWHGSLTVVYVLNNLAIGFSGLQFEINDLLLYYVILSGVPTDEEQATGLERRALQALKHGKVVYYTHFTSTHTLIY